MEQTKKQRFFEIIRFLLVGGLSTILDYATTYGLGILLIGFWFNAAVSNTVGHIVGLLVNFFLSVVFVYKQVKNKEESKSFKAFALFVLVFIAIIVGIIYVETAERRIPIQYANKSNSTLGKQNYIPFKLNSAGVMPVIFASALLSIPQIIASVIKNEKFTLFAQK